VRGCARHFILDTIRGRKGILPALTRGILRGLSVGYGAAVRVRNAAFDAGLLPARRLPGPVISVGNLTAGGTGKTPAVEYLARLLESMGRKPAVLARGYGAKTPEGPSDEVASMAPETRVYASPDRFASGMLALSEGADVLVLDDGFQHRKLARDLDLLLVDALDPWGGGRLLPAGFLREPASSARRAGAVMITRADLVPPERREALRRSLERLGADGPCFEACHAPYALEGDLAGPPSTLKGMPAVLFSGLGNPEGFRGTARALGVDIRADFPFPDHHAYTERDMRALVEETDKLGAKLLLTTAKDWVKVKDLPRGATALSALRVRLELLDGEDRLETLIAQSFDRAGFAPTQETRNSKPEPRNDTP